MLPIDDKDLDDLARKVYDNFLELQEFEIEPGHILSDHDRKSAAWDKASKFLESELQRLRTENDMNLSATATADLRGQIKMAKRILSLGQESPAPGEDNELDDPDLGY